MEDLSLAVELARLVNRAAKVSIVNKRVYVRCRAEDAARVLELVETLGRENPERVDRFVSWGVS